MKFINARLMLVFFIFLSACSYNVEKNKSSLLSQSTQESFSNDFSSIKEIVFSPSCISCHQQYNNYASVLREISAIQNAVFANRMPKSGPALNENQKSVLNAWIKKGAPEFKGTPALPNVISSLEPTWTSVSENTLFPKCLVCHNPQGQAKFLDLSSRQIIFINRNRLFAEGSKLIDFDFPEKSYLLEVLQDDEEPMPPKWSNIPRLSDDELKNIARWITLGLP